MSEDPICNSITVYGCYMNPERGILQCRVPSSSGFIPCSRNYYSNDEQDKIVPVVGGSHVNTHV
jgi:hypothetical protein